jgi:hypothetical protein
VVTAKPAAHHAPPSTQGKVKLMDGERVVFTEESNPQNYLKLIANGDVDGTMLEACEAAKATTWYPKRGHCGSPDAIHDYECAEAAVARHGPQRGRD